MKSRIRTLERALALELTEIALRTVLEKLKNRWELAASKGGPEPTSFDLSDALRDAGIAGLPALPYAMRYVDRHARDEGGPDCATIFKILLRGSPVPDTLQRPGAGLDDDAP